MSTESGSEPFEKFSTWAVDEMLAQERGEKPYAPVFEDERPKSPVDAEKAMSGSESVDTRGLRSLGDHNGQSLLTALAVDSLCDEIDRLRTVIAACDQEIAEFHDDVLRHSQRIEEAVKLLRELYGAVHLVLAAPMPNGWVSLPGGGELRARLNDAYYACEAFLEQETP